MRIEWTEPASRDLIAIGDYTGQHLGLARARATALQISEAINSLKQFPNMGRTGRRAGTRELVLPGLPFVAVYRLRNELVEILRVLHGAQRWP